MPDIAAAVTDAVGELVSFPSVSSSSNADISDYLGRRLQAAGFELEPIGYIDDQNVPKVSLVAVRRGEDRRRRPLGYLAHSDVVPADDWHSGEARAFQPQFVDGRILGRGTCDMKGSLAAALIAAESIPIVDQPSDLFFVVTADEEIGMEGASQVVAHSRLYREMCERGCRCVVGEPTELRVVHAHKGTLLLNVVATGISRHSSSTDGVNANDALVPALAELDAIRRSIAADERFADHAFDPPGLSWNWTIRNEPLANNITASLASVTIFVRPARQTDIEEIVARVAATAARHNLRFERSHETRALWTNPDDPFVRRMLALTKQPTSMTVAYGTDAGVLTGLSPVVICGPGSIAYAHTNRESIAVEELVGGVDLYRRLFSGAADG